MSKLKTYSCLISNDIKALHLSSASPVYLLHLQLAWPWGSGALPGRPGEDAAARATSLPGVEAESRMPIKTKGAAGGHAARANPSGTYKGGGRASLLEGEEEGTWAC